MKRGNSFRTYLGRYAGEALRPGEVIDCHCIELDVAFLFHGLIGVASRLIALHAIGQPTLQIALGRKCPEACQGCLARSLRRARRRREAI